MRVKLIEHVLESRMKKIILLITSMIVLSGCELNTPSFDKNKPVDKDNYVNYICVNGVQYFNIRYNDTGILSPLYRPDGKIEVCGDGYNMGY